MVNPEGEPQAQQQAAPGNEMKSEFIEKMSEIPAVNAAAKYGSAMYNQVKEYNSLTSATLSVAETALLNLVLTAKPFLEKVQPHAQMIDQLACQGLDKVEEIAPFVKLPPEQLVEEARKLTSTTIEFANEKAVNIKAYGSDTLNSVKNYGIEKCHQCLDDTENFVEKHLPPPFGNASAEAATESSSVHERANNLKSKITTRLTGHVIQRAMSINAVAEVSASKLFYCFELLGQLKENTNKSVQEYIDEAKVKASWVWDELNKEPAESTEARTSLEQRALSLARRLTSILVHTYNTRTLPSSPISYQDAVKTAHGYATELFTAVDQATNAGGITINLLQTVREKVTALEALIQDLKSQEIEMEILNAAEPSESDVVAEPSESDVVAENS